MPRQHKHLYKGQPASTTANASLACLERFWLAAMTALWDPSALATTSPHPAPKMPQQLPRGLSPRCSASATGGLLALTTLHVFPAHPIPGAGRAFKMRARHSQRAPCFPILCRTVLVFQVTQGQQEAPVPPVMLASSPTPAIVHPVYSADLVLTLQILHSSVCLLCSPGTYESMLNASACDACSAGTFLSGSGITNSIACTGCFMGTFSNQAASTCTICTAGTYSSAHRSTECLNCRAGFFQDQPSSLTCIPCDAGTLQTATGSTYCDECALGWYTTYSALMQERNVNGQTSVLRSVKPGDLAICNHLRKPFNSRSFKRVECALAVCCTLKSL